MADLRAKVKQFLGREFNHTEVLIANSIDTNCEFRIFKWDVKDESGNANHGTASNITYGEDKWYAFAALFNLSLIHI